MDHSEMPALADGLTAGYDKQNWGMNLNLHRKISALIDIFNFGQKNSWGWARAMPLPVATAIVMPRLPGDGVIIQNILGVVKTGVTVHKTFGSDLKYKEVWISNAKNYKIVLLSTLSYYQLLCTQYWVCTFKVCRYTLDLNKSLSSISLESIELNRLDREDEQRNEGREQLVGADFLVWQDSLVIS